MNADKNGSDKTTNEIVRERGHALPNHEAVRVGFP